MTLDTNIVIAYLQGDEGAVQAILGWRKIGVTLFISTVAEAELYSLSSLTSREFQYIEQFIDENFTVIPFDRRVARITGEIRRATKVKLPDAAIAATALVTHTPLVTRNTKDFQGIQALSLFEI